MKRIILFLAIIIGIFTAPAASYAENTPDKSHLGVRMSFDLNTSTTYSSVIKWGPGASIGGCYYAPFGRMTYFNPGFMFCYNTLKIDGAFKNTPKRNFKGTMSIIGLHFPLNIGLKFYQTEKLKLSVYTGPGLYFNFSVRGKYDLIKGNGTIKIDEKLSNPGMEIGWGLGVAADISRRWHVHLEGTYGLSHLGESEELRDLGDHSYFNRAELSLGLGYNF